jgi:hypothetical protein
MHNGLVENMLQPLVFVEQLTLVPKQQVFIK